MRRRTSRSSSSVPEEIPVQDALEDKDSNGLRKRRTRRPWIPTLSTNRFILITLVTGTIPVLKLFFTAHDEEINRKYHPDEHRPVLVQVGSQHKKELHHGVQAGEHASPVTRDWKAELMAQDKWQDEDCLPMYEWQIFQPLSCYIMHEIDLTPRDDDNLRFINCGARRCTFRLEDTAGIEPVVLKLGRIKKDDIFEYWAYDDARYDSLVMEHLTRSPYILDIYGHCGVSQLVEYGVQGNLHDQIKIARQNDGGSAIDSLEKLKIAVQITSAVADLHDGGERNASAPVLSHLDICCHQFINIDGVYKLGDFNGGGFMKRHRETDEVCKEKPKSMFDNEIKMAAPEELLDMYESDDENRALIHWDKADVYSMGNVLYYLLTSHWIMEGIDQQVAREWLLEGKRSTMPRHFLRTTNMAEKAIVRAILAAWTHDPEERRRSRYIAGRLQRELRILIGGNPGDVVRAIVPPLPENHRHTDNDFVDNLNLGQYGDEEEEYDDAYWGDDETGEEGEEGDLQESEDDSERREDGHSEER